MPTKVLFVATECVPFIKTGGLADVVGSLPKALLSHDIDIRVVIPKYGLISDQYKKMMKPIQSFHVKIGWRNAYCGIETLKLDGVTYYFIDNEYYFKRESLYGHYDDGERFAFYDRAVLEMIAYIDFKPDILHVHDWHLGMTPLMYQLNYKDKEGYQGIKTIMTVHNLQYQGWFDLNVLTDLCDIGVENFYNGTTRQDGSVNFLKTGIVTADYVTTVSKTYAEEIQDFYFGEGLDQVIKLKKGRLVGIKNGIDVDHFNPKTDSFIKIQYDYEHLSNKYKNKTFLQERFKLPKDKDIPIISFISRLVDQKGLDILIDAFSELLEFDVQFILLGEGDAHYHQFFEEMTKKYPDQVKVYFGFNEKLARQIYAGSDFLVMPSLFEPCGLSQMIAMRYGTIPIVRETGGLKDTVVPYNEYTKTGSGFGFKSYSSYDFLNVVEYALELYNDKSHFNQIIKNAMSIDFSWEQSAKDYDNLYKKVIDLP